MFATPIELAELAAELAAAGRLRIAQQRPLVLIDGACANGLSETAVATMRAFHQEHPLQPAVPKSALAAALPRQVPEVVLDALLRDLVAGGEVCERSAGVSLATHQVELSGEQERIREALVGLYDAAGFAPPSIDDAYAQIAGARADADQVFHLLLRQGTLVRLRDDLVYGAAPLESLISELRSRYSPGDSFSVADFKGWTELSRKHAIPLLEYLDQHRITRREGDKRVRV